MLVETRFDHKRVMGTINKICEVSEYVIPHVPNLFNTRELKQYIKRGHRRLAVVSKQFEQVGYKVITQEFDFGGLAATNTLFVRGKITDGIILFTAHHDYIAGLGAEDNATALAIMIELSRCLDEKETRVIFASFDLEELGLIGSRHFVGSPFGKQLQPLSTVVALECLGSGRDVVICDEVIGAKSDPFLVSSLCLSARNLGHPIVSESFNWFNSDHVPFAERGIKTVEVCSFNSENYKGRSSPDVNVAHSSLDVTENILPSTLKVVGEVLLQFMDDFWTTERIS